MVRNTPVFNGANSPRENVVPEPFGTEFVRADFEPLIKGGIPAVVNGGIRAVI